MRRVGPAALITAILLSACAATGPLEPQTADAYKAEIDRLNALLAAETAERQRITRAAARREEALKRQLDAMKAIERGILEREDRLRTETR